MDDPIEKSHFIVFIVNPAPTLQPKSPVWIIFPFGKTSWIFQVHLDISGVLFYHFQNTHKQRC